VLLCTLGKIINITVILRRAFSFSSVLVKGDLTQKRRRTKRQFLSRIQGINVLDSVGFTRIVAIPPDNGDTLNNIGGH